MVKVIEVKVKGHSSGSESHGHSHNVEIPLKSGGRRNIQAFPCFPCFFFRLLSLSRIDSHFYFLVPQSYGLIVLVPVVFLVVNSITL